MPIFEWKVEKHIFCSDQVCKLIASQQVQKVGLKSDSKNAFFTFQRILFLRNFVFCFLAKWCGHMLKTSATYACKCFLSRVTRDRCYDLKNIFAKNSAKKNWGFWLKTKLNYAKILIVTSVLEKTANFFAESCRKSQKVVIITSTPDEFVKIRPEYSRAQFCSKITNACGKQYIGHEFGLLQKFPKKNCPK
jgi:hypothetical protein